MAVTGGSPSIAPTSWARCPRPVPHRDTLRVSSVGVDLRTLRYFVAVAEERNFGRAAARLHMSQPPLSRAIKGLEAEFGTVLVNRSASGATLTPAGSVLYAHARRLLEQADGIRAHVLAATKTTTVTIGVLADSADQAGTRLAVEFRRRHPHVNVRIREADLADPSAGLRAGLVDIALTRAPFDQTGISVHVVRADPVGVVLRDDDPLARHPNLTVRELTGRRWFRFPDGTDTLWQAFWNGSRPDTVPSDGPVVRTVTECLQAVLWNNSIGLTPVSKHSLPDGLIVIPLSDMPPSHVVVARRREDTNPLLRSFTQIAVNTLGARTGATRAR